MAEAVFAHTAKVKGYSDRFDVIDSFGTSGWHIGELPDSRSAKTCRKHGIPVNHSAQQILRDHFHQFDYVLCMDSSNKNDLEFMKPKGCKAVVKLFGDYGTDTQFDKIVMDPYYGGIDGFEVNLRQLTHFLEEFLNQVVEK